MGTIVKKATAIALALAMILAFSACGSSEEEGGAATDNSTLVYGSNDYTRINPAIDEHGEINLLLFDGLMGHDENNGVVSALAKSYELDEDTNTYTFHLRDDVKWHDGEDFTAEDVKFTIEAGRALHLQPTKTIAAELQALRKSSSKS